MRISTISSSFAALVANVIDVVVVAGIAVRFVLLTTMRERGTSTGTGHWHLPGQPNLDRDMAIHASWGLRPELLRQPSIKRQQYGQSKHGFAFAHARVHG